MPPNREVFFVSELSTLESEHQPINQFVEYGRIIESGIDKVVKAAELYQLPAPDFRAGESRTTTVLFCHQDFDSMSQSDRIRACYQHCCLLYISNERTSNQTLRERFKLPSSKASTVSLIISATKEAGLIKQDQSESNSTRYARYLPFWG